MTGLTRAIVDAVMSAGYLPPSVACGGQEMALELAMLQLARHATGRNMPAENQRRLSLDAIPGVADAVERLKTYKDWRIHGPRYHQAAIVEQFRRQCWTLKPAFTAEEYDRDVGLGRHLNPMFERR